MRFALPARLAAPALILVVLAMLWPGAPVTPLSSYDQRFYLGIAYDLRQFGRFTDGFSYAGGGPGRPGVPPRPPGMRFTPLYPAFLAAASWFDPGLRRAIACVERTAGRDPACPRAAPVVRGAQFLMLGGFYWLLWGAVGRACGTARAGWIGLGFALLTAPSLLRFVNTLMTETLSLLLSAAACALALEAWQRGRTGPGAAGRGGAWWFGCGVVLGLGALARPALLYLLWAGLAAAAAAAVRQRSVRPLASGAACGLGVGLVVLPWVLRNALLLHRAALSFGYASHTLIQRVAFDAMTPREYGLSFVCWLPDGSGLGRLIAGRGACDRFGWDDHPNSFYAIGTGPLLRQSLAASGGWPNHLHYVVRHYLLAAPLPHLLTTIPLALRGLYVDHYWGLLLAPVSAWATLRALRRRQAAVLLLSLPAWFLLLFNAVVAVNQPRYNLLLVLPFSLAGAMLIDGILRRRGAGAASAAFTSGNRRMSIFGSILSKIFSHPAAAAAPGTPAADASASETPAATAPAATAPAAATPVAAAAVGAAPGAAAPAPVDVEAVLTALAANNPQSLNWRSSIVDLMKLLDLDSSLKSRTELAHELNYGGDTSDSASMNVWLHGEVMRKLEENGGTVPADLKG